MFLFSLSFVKKNAKNLSISDKDAESAFLIGVLRNPEAFTRFHLLKLFPTMFLLKFNEGHKIHKISSRVSLSKKIEEHCSLLRGSSCDNIKLTKISVLVCGF